MPWLTAVWLVKSTKDRKTRYLMYVLCLHVHKSSETRRWPCSDLFLFYCWIFCRKWRNPKPTTSWFCSGIPDASSGLFTPTAPRPKRSPSWPALAQKASQLRWSRASTSTTQTESSSARSQPKPCLLAWTPLPSPAICGRPRSRGHPKNTQSSTRWLVNMCTYPTGNREKKMRIMFDIGQALIPGIWNAMMQILQIQKWL